MAELLDGSAFDAASGLATDVHEEIDDDSGSDVSYVELEIQLPTGETTYSPFVLTPVVETTPYAISDVAEFTNILFSKTIERLTPSGEFVVEFDEGIVAVFGFEEQTDSEGESLAAFHTIERELPRQILKDVWDFNDEGVLEKTGEQDWFLDPRKINDTRVDSITINGADGIDDEFIVGNEILNRDTDEEEISFDVLQITHTQEGVADDSVVITVRSMTLDYMPDESDPTTVINDTISIDGKSGNDTILAGVVPNLPDRVAAKDVVIGRVANELNLIGGDGDDTLVGSKYTDKIEMGDGNNRVTVAKALTSRRRCIELSRRYPDRIVRNVEFDFRVERHQPSYHLRTTNHDLQR